MLSRLGRTANLAVDKGSHLRIREFASVVDEIITFARTPSKRDWNEVGGILKAGAEQHSGLQAGRLQIAHAELAFENGRWNDAVDSCDLAAFGAEKFFGLEPASHILANNIRSAAKEIQFRSLLALGDDQLALIKGQEELKASYDLGEIPGIARLKLQAKLDAHSRMANIFMILGDGLNAKRQLQSALGFERMFAKRLNTLDGPQKPTESRSTRQHGVAQSYGNRRVSVGDQPVKNVLLPMTPGDIYMSSSLLRLGVFHYIQGDSVAAARFLQRAAMAAAAVAAQDEEVHSQGGPLPVTRFLQPETSLAGFFGHVQIGFARAIDKQGWERLEQHLENALGRAESVTGSEHPRVMAPLIALSEVYAHTERPTFAEGLCRTGVKMVYKNANPPAPLSFRQQPPSIHPSLACLLDWRYAQLLTVLPKRETEAFFWQHHARASFSNSGLGSRIEDVLGELTALKGGSEQPCGGFVDLSIRRLVPCIMPLMR